MPKSRKISPLENWSRKINTRLEINDFSLPLVCSKYLPSHAQETNGESEVFGRLSLADGEGRQTLVVFNSIDSLNWYKNDKMKNGKMKKIWETESLEKAENLENLNQFSDN